jgi:wobble nucleotide-excising tRNase
MFKALEIINVGRFKLLKPRGDVSFTKNTFIYGKNTFGKSTLAAIFHSLKDNNPDYILGRKSVGSEKQTVKLIPRINTPVAEYRYTTDENKWSSEYEGILIFDGSFVRESVYTQTQQIGQEQQKNIEAFMLGSKGTEFNWKISELTAKIAENTKIQTSTTTEYNRSKHLLGNLSFDKFLALTDIADVEKKIQSVKKKFDKINNFDIISTKLNALKTLLEQYSEFDFSTISQELTVNSEVIAKHYEEHINKAETKQSYSSFLELGSKLRKRSENEKCAFCTQEITSDDAKTFLETIDKVYNENYRTLLKKLKEAEELFSIENFSAEVAQINADLEQAGHYREEEYSSLMPLIKACGEIVKLKKEDLSVKIRTDKFTELDEEINVAVAAIDTELEKFKDPAQSKSDLDITYKELLATRERHSSWNDRCTAYLYAKRDSESLSTQKSRLWDEYLLYANSLSETMLADINGVLTDTGCNFSAQNFNFKGNQRQDLLVLVLNGQEILNDGKDNEITIKNCLSDSDKGILALAFFLATIKNDSTTKVVVMDDPVSSLDSDRKRLVLREIRKVFKDTDKQLILLTHERGFYHLLHAENGWESPVFLKIIYEDQEGSSLTVCDPATDAEFMNDFNIWIANMKGARDSNDLTFVRNTHSEIRKVIEHILKAKYPLELKTEDKTVERMLTRLEENSGPYSTTSPRVQINDLLTNLDHHDQSKSGQYPVEALGILDYKRDIQDAFVVIKLL